MAGRFTVESAFKVLDKFSGPVVAMTKRTENLLATFDKGLGKISHFNDRVTAAMKAVGAAGLAAGGVVGAGLLDIAKSGADFDKAMSAVGAVSLMSRDQVADLEKEALRLGSSMDGFGFKATQVAGAMELMGKAGYSNTEILQTIPGLLAAAAAEGMDLSEAAGIVSNTLKGMGLAASETTRVADVLTLASARTNSSISSLGESMAIASSTARQFKVPFEQVVASVALLQDVGLDASTAGTAVSTMLTKLAAPSAKASKEIAALGLKFQDVHGNMLPLPEIFAQFEKAAGKAGGNMRAVAFFSELVGLRGEKAALNMKELFASGKFGDLVKELEAAAGSAKKMGTLRMDNVSGDLDMMSAKADALKDRLFGLERGPLRGVTKGINDWIDANQGLIQSKAEEYVAKFEKHLPEIVTWGERIAIGVGGYMALATGIKVVSTAVEGVQLAMGGTRLAVQGFTGAAKGAAKAVAWLGSTTVGSTIADGASTAATWVKNAAVTAYNGVVSTGSSLLGLNTGATVASSEAAVANIAATGEKTVGQLALNTETVAGTGALTAYTGATEAATAATVEAEAALSPLLVTLGAVAGAIGAVYMAWDQLQKLDKETEGLGFFGTVGEMVKQGTWDPAKAVDTYQNQQAEARSASADRGDDVPRASVVGPYDPRMSAPEGAYGELTVKAPPGTVQVSKKPKAGYRVRLTQSGGM